MRSAGILIAGLLLASCGRPTPADRPKNDAVVPEANKPTRPTTTPPARENLPEPRGPIDPNSAEAAGQVVQKFAALIEERRFAEAARLWASPAAASTFITRFRYHAETHIEIGKPGEPEGAAGSIYVAMPVVFYGKDGSGRDYRRSAEVTLRRVNDVPGSTEAERRWHIERIDWIGSA